MNLTTYNSKTELQSIIFKQWQKKSIIELTSMPPNRFKGNIEKNPWLISLIHHHDFLYTSKLWKKLFCSNCSTSHSTFYYFIFFPINHVILSFLHNISIQSQLFCCFLFRYRPVLLFNFLFLLISGDQFNFGDENKADEMKRWKRDSFIYYFVWKLW